MRRAIILSTLLLALLLGAGCGESTEEGISSGEPGATSRTTSSRSGSSKGPQWADEVARLDAAIEASLSKAEQNATDWLSLDIAAGTHLQRARLTGSYDDYARAEELLEKAFTIAPEGSGPFLTRASLNYSLHRLSRVGADLDRLAALPGPIRPKPEVLLLKRGTLAFQKGDYAESRRLLQESVDEKAGFSNLSSLAMYFWKTGDFDTAEKLYRDALKKYKGTGAEPRAWLHLQLGLMDLDRGRLEQALEHYFDADKELAGWYLVDEHIAEIYVEQGRIDEALAIYMRVESATGNPEFMDAIASIHRDAERIMEAEDWTRRAREAYEKQLLRFPEAAYGHALGHFLEFSQSRLRTVQLAEKNHDIRPNAESKTLLADAYLAADRAKDARKVIEEALESEGSGADIHVVASGTYTALGLHGLAQDQRSQAIAINPSIFD